jgi:hypothetical protein
MLLVDLLLVLTFIFVGVISFFEGNAWLGIFFLFLGISMIAARYDSKRRQKETNYVYLDSTGSYSDYHGHAMDCHDIGGGDFGCGDSGGSCD